MCCADRGCSISMQSTGAQQAHPRLILSVCCTMTSSRPSVLEHGSVFHPLIDCSYWYVDPNKGDCTNKKNQADLGCDVIGGSNNPTFLLSNHFNNATAYQRYIETIEELTGHRRVKKWTRPRRRRRQRTAAPRRDADGDPPSSRSRPSSRRSS